MSLLPTSEMLCVDGRDFRVKASYCELFIGQLSIFVDIQASSDSIIDIPCRDAIHFADLQHCDVTMDDTRSSSHDNPLIKPAFWFDDRVHSIDSLQFSSRALQLGEQLLAIELAFNATDREQGTRRVVTGQIVCEFLPIDRTRLLLKQQLIPIRFTQHYLPLVDLPAIAVGASRAQVVAIFGEPESTGGGQHPQFGLIPHWILYVYPEFLLRCEFESDTIVNIILMPALGFPGCEVSSE